MILSVLIPTWNGWSFLEPTLTALRAALACVEGGFEVIVIDDGGSDRTAEKLEAHYPWIRLVRRATNGGFSAACNSGISVAQGEWVLLLNNDMAPDEQALTMLLEAARDASPEVFSLRPRIQRRRQLSDDAYAHMGMQFRLHFGMLRLSLVRYAESTAGTGAFPAASGGAALVRRTQLVELGGFDEVYSPFYWEDVDLSYRALCRGWVTQYVPESIFRHAVRGTIAEHFEPVRVKRVSQRNAYWFHWLNLQDRRLLIRHFGWLPARLLISLLRMEFWHLGAFLDACAGWGRIKGGRKKRLARRVVSDAAIFAASRQGTVVETWKS